MYNKDTIPFFIIIIPFFCLLFLSFFTTSYYLKISNALHADAINEYNLFIKDKYSKNKIAKLLEIKEKKHLEKQEEFFDFILIITSCLCAFLLLFTFMMKSIINDIVLSYINKVKAKENSLQDLNQTLESKVKIGIEEAKKKDKALLHQSKLASLGSMINMIAHQWRQPLSELSAVLMELELATRFKKVNEKHILSSIQKSDKMIAFMSNTIEDFRNFYKPDKKKEEFYISDACNKAIVLIDATLKNLGIRLNLKIENDKKINAYAREYSQVILNIISNAKDSLMERKISKPEITIVITSKQNKSLLLIKDNANGIEEKYLESIFEPYFSTKSFSKGTGLGLYISKLIIEKNMNGELSVQNDALGAVFSVKV